ncbi:MAG: Na+/H+ antiporter NhaA [Hasllibacter sp.]
MLLRALDRFYRHEASGGVLLMASAVAALAVANSGLSDLYRAVLDTYGAVTIGGTGIEKPLILWINDGLMAIFFFLIGLELKRELVEGKLKNPRDIIMPGLAAVGGMALPALVFFFLNMDSPETLRGWAIPAATDIAFALGILALVGARAPAALKVFLLTLAILDDMGAILIIALFYTANLEVDYLLLALIPLVGLFLLARSRAHRVAPFLLLGLVMWVLVLKSGVHATLAGVVTAFFIPIKDRHGKSPLHSLEHGLAPYVLFGIVPVFAFANAGVVLDGIGWETFAQPLTSGIALGLVVGKIVGVTGMVALCVATGIARKPHGVTWMHIFGIACLAGVGFTMSLFIGSLSFDSEVLMNQVRLGVLSGSAVAGVLGYAALMLAPDARVSEADQSDVHGGPEHVFDPDKEAQPAQ